MALSGTVKTNADSNGRYYQLSWTATQSIADNTSTISWTLSAQGYTSGWIAERTLYVTIDGSKVYSKTDRVERYTGTIKTGTKTITHNSNGSRSFTITVGAAVYGTSVNCTGSGTFALNTIARASTLSVSAGTLGTSQTITADRKSSSFTHTLTWTSGSYSGTIATKSSATSWSFTPSLNLANGATTSTSVSVKFKLATYNGSTLVGEVQKTVSMFIPASVVPTCTVSVTDPTGYSSTYGGYIQNKSKMQVTVTATQAYSSPIRSYIIQANGSTYSENPATTSVIRTSGTNTIVGKATDNRSRTGSTSTTIEVIPYTSPSMEFTMYRCDEDGIENVTGSYCKVTYRAEITSLSNLNSKSIQLRYKRTSETSYTSQNIEMTDYIQESSIIFSADDASSYNVQMRAIDAFETVTKSAELSTAFSIMHIAASGKGLAVGKISQTDEFEVGMDARFYNGAHFTKGYTEDIPLFESPGDCNDLLTTGHYYAYGDVANRPLDRNGWISVKAYTDNRWCHQEFVTWDGRRYFRYRAGGNWKDWVSLDYADVVIDTGTTTSNGWKYRKWDSGKIELWYTKTLTNLAITNTLSGASVTLYYANNNVQFDSGLLTSVENAQVTICRSPGLYFSNISTCTTSQMNFRIVGTKSETVATMDVYVYVIGTWK